MSRKYPKPNKPRRKVGSTSMSDELLPRSERPNCHICKKVADVITDCDDPDCWEVPLCTTCINTHRHSPACKGRGNGGGCYLLDAFYK